MGTVIEINCTRTKLCVCVTHDHGRHMLPKLNQMQFGYNQTKNLQVIIFTFLFKFTKIQLKSKF